MTRWLLVVALLLGGCGTTVTPNAGPSPAAVGWREYRSEAGRYRVLMPAEPAVGTEQRGASTVGVAMIGPMPETMQTFTVLHRDLVGDELKVPPAEMLQRALKEGGTPGEVRELPGGGVEGVYAVGKERVARTRAFLVKGRLYTVTALYPTTPAATSEATKFLESFAPL